jgi:hypothetical protein
VTEPLKKFATGSDQLALELCVISNWLKVVRGCVVLHRYMHTTAKRQKLWLST